jgi:molecular chaperone GrpE
MKKKDSEKSKQPVPAAESKEPARQAEGEPLQQLQQQLQELQTKHDELFARLQRLSADYTNYQKRTAKQIADSVAYEKELLVKSLLPALDNFERALAATESAQNAPAVRDGVRMVYEHILDILKTHGLEQIQGLGQVFDPVVHEAVTQRKEPDKQAGAVLEEFEKGYKLNGRVIRPCKVVVNSLPAPQPEPAEPTQPGPHKQIPGQAGDIDETTDTE